MPEWLRQFLLVTLGGAGITFFWNSLRDEEGRRQTVLNSLRELAAQLDEHYRATKQIKRMIRSRQKEVAQVPEISPHCFGDQCGVPNNSAPKVYEIEADFFAERMDALSNVQLKIEVARNAVRALPDMIGQQRLKRIVRYLAYSADYLHDVIEEFEKRCVSRLENVYWIEPVCVNLTDFLGPRWEPMEAAPKELFDSWNAFMDGESNAGGVAPVDEENLSPEVLSLSARFDAFRRIIASDSVKNLCRKTKSLSDECMLQAMRELRQEIMINRPLVSLRPFRRWPSDS
jgi:hypothetical protein